MKTFLFSFFFLLFSTFTLFAQTFLPLQKITASDRSTGALFGSALSISGNYAIVGAQSETEDVLGYNTLVSAGASYIFERATNGSWQIKQKLVPSDRTAGDYFGGSVAISGTTAVVSAFDKDAFGVNTYLHAGTFYIFERDTVGVWQEKQKILALDTGAGDHFGYKIAISNNYIIVGSPIDGEDENGNNTLNASGSAYIFEKDGNGVWNQVQKIVASDRAAAALFGAAVDISGNYAIVGAYQEDTDSAGNNSLSNAGAAYVYERDGNGHWQQIEKLVTTERSMGDRFGIAVSIYGNSAIVGAYLEDEDEQGLNFKSAAGSAYIFKRDTTTGNWSQQKKLVAADRASNDYFGQAVFINEDYAFVGAPNQAKDAFGNNPLTTAGAGYLYKKDTSGNWYFLQKIVAADRAMSDNFGIEIAIDNDLLMVGAHFEDDDTLGNNPMNAAGSAYFLKRCNATYATRNDTVCKSYTSPSGNYTWNTSGVYNDTITNLAGCDSIITISLTINTVDTLVIQDGALLIANDSTSTYQWLNCDNNTLIQGATQQQYMVITSGNYALEISKNTCVDTSSCYTVISLKIADELKGNRISVFPNPSNEFITITIENTDDIDQTIKLINQTGQVVYSEILKTTSINYQLNVANYATGIYLLLVTSEQYQYKTKLVIDN